MLEPILEGLRDVGGMHGALVVDHTGAVLAHRAHSIYDLQVLQQAARAIVAATDSVQLIQDDWEVLTTHFSEGKVVLRHLRVAGARPRSYILAVIADQTINVAFLGVALRVAASKLIAVLEAAPAAAVQSSAVASPTGSRRSPADSRPDYAQAGFARSESSTSLVNGSDFAAVDAASTAFLSACAHALTASIGPMAKIYIRDAVRKVCGGRAFSRADGPALLSQLYAMLDSPEDRVMFQRATRAL